MSQYFLTGSYAEEQDEGIKLWEFEHGTLKEINGISGIERPSFLAVHPNGQSFVATSETGPGELVAYQVDAETATLKEINRQSSNGDHPAHVCIDDSGKWVLSVNYSGANLNSFPLRGDGSIGDLADSITHEGSGPNAERQDAAHPHSVFQIPGTDLFLVSDLGTDTIYAYALDTKTGKLTLKAATSTALGAGPRHLAFHPFKAFVYSVEELRSSVTVYELSESGGLSVLQTVSAIPDNFKETNTSAEIAVSANGRFLYVSNRGHDSIAAFEIQQNGELKRLASMPAGGTGPRHFTLASNDQQLIVCNENSGTITIMEIDGGGVPQTTGQVLFTTSPVCIKEVK